MSAEKQTELLANYIMSDVPGEPSQDEGAGDTAVRLLKRYRAALTKIKQELGVPDENYPAPVANAYNIALVALVPDGWIV